MRVSCVFAFVNIQLCKRFKVGDTAGWRMAEELWETVPQGLGPWQAKGGEKANKGHRAAGCRTQMFPYKKG